MRIRCDYTICSNECKYFEYCNLHQPSNFSLVQVREELNWNVSYLNEINRGINHFNNMLFQFEHNQLPLFIMGHTSKEKISNKITQLRTEKKETITKIKEYQIKEKNIIKILERRNLGGI